MDVTDLLSNFGLSSLAECSMGFPKFPGIQEIRMNSTYFWKSSCWGQSSEVWICREESAQEKITMKNRMSFKPEEIYKHILLSDAAEKKLEIGNADIQTK